MIAVTGGIQNPNTNTPNPQTSPVVIGINNKGFAINAIGATI